MRPGSLAILGIAAYSAFLVATLPARWAAERMGVRGDGLALHSVEGTIWHGDAQAVVGLGGGTFTVDRLAWSFLPSRLLQGRLGYDIAAQGAGFEAKGEAARSFSGWSVRNLTARADAALATAALPWTGPWSPAGSVNATVPSLEIAGREARGNLQLEWRNAASALSEVKPLGSYRAEVAAEGAAASLRVSTLEGALRVSGQGRLEFPSRLTFTGEARAEGDKARALQPMLDLIGPARADGSRAIDWRTR